MDNRAEPGSLDVEVRRWCKRNGVLYQPYASGRNLSRLPPRYLTALREIAAGKKGQQSLGRSGVSIYACALQFMMQTGAVVIPRSNSEVHLRENIQLAVAAAAGSGWTLTQQEMHLLGWQEEEGDQQDL